MIYVVTRHAGLVQWLDEHGYVIIDGEQPTIVDHVTDELIEQLKPGDAVIGIAPPHLIARINARGARFFAVELPRLPREWRGKELTPEMMDEAGAEVREVRVSISHALTPRAMREVLG